MHLGAARSGEALVSSSFSCARFIHCAANPSKNKFARLFINWSARHTTRIGWDMLYGTSVTVGDYDTVSSIRWTWDAARTLSRMAGNLIFGKRSNGRCAREK